MGRKAKTVTITGKAYSALMEIATFSMAVFTDAKLLPSNMKLLKRAVDVVGEVDLDPIEATDESG